MNLLKAKTAACFLFVFALARPSGDSARCCTRADLQPALQGVNGPCWCIAAAVLLVDMPSHDEHSLECYVPWYLS